MEKMKKQKVTLLISIFVLTFLPAALVLGGLSFGGGRYTNLCGSGYDASFYACPANCNPSTGSCSGNYVARFTCDGERTECLSNETWGASFTVNNPYPGCNKTVQLDVFTKNCRVGGGSWDCNNIPCGQAGSDCTGYMVWYSGACAPPSPSPSPPPTLGLSIFASPASGNAPLNGVDITATVSGTASGNITYRFDCTSDNAWDLVQTTGQTSYTAVDLCDYNSPGAYQLRTQATRESLVIRGTISIVVGQTATLAVRLSADPYYGNAPLNGVDITATVSGTATGNIVYRFDCTSDGAWDLVQTTSQTSYTAVDLCDYPNAGNFNSKVQVERNGIRVEGTAGILVI